LASLSSLADEDKADDGEAEEGFSPSSSSSTTVRSRVAAVRGLSAKEAECIEQERRFRAVKAEAEVGESNRIEVEATAELRVQGLRAELAAVDARLDTLRARREKLERKGSYTDSRAGPDGSYSHSEEPDPEGAREIVGALEARLRGLQLERGRVDADPHAYAAASMRDEKNNALSHAPHAHARAHHHQH